MMLPVLFREYEWDASFLYSFGLCGGRCSVLHPHSIEIETSTWHGQGREFPVIGQIPVVALDQLSRSQLRGSLQQGCPLDPIRIWVKPNTSRTGATGDGIRVQRDRTIPRQSSTVQPCASSHGDGGQCQDASLKDRVCSQSR